MERFQQRLDTQDARTPARHLTLPYADRCKSRLRVTLDDGSDAGLFLPRGSVLCHGDRLLGDGGTVLEIRAAPEALYAVQANAESAAPHFDLLRAAYHLGNRHVPLRLQPQRLLLERDVVLREMLLRLGVRVSEVVEPFDPEPGAYGGGHRHDHDASGGMLGELLSREAHGDLDDDVPDYGRQAFAPPA